MELVQEDAMRQIDPDRLRSCGYRRRRKLECSLHQLSVEGLVLVDSEDAIRLRRAFAYVYDAAGHPVVRARPQPCVWLALVRLEMPRLTRDDDAHIRVGMCMRKRPVAGEIGRAHV